MKMMKKMIATALVLVSSMTMSMVSMANSNQYYCTEMIVKNVTNYGSTLVDDNGEAWLDNQCLEVGSKYVVVMDCMNTETIYYDEIVGIVAVD